MDEGDIIFMELSFGDNFVVYKKREISEEEGMKLVASGGAINIQEITSSKLRDLFDDHTADALRKEKFKSNIRKWFKKRKHKKEVPPEDI